jgi:HAD superfamily hydrolase (TIGR01509 family)
LVDILSGKNGIIFDMDGTLIDSTQTWIDADVEFGYQNGFVYTEEMLIATKTLKFMKACEYLSQFCDYTPEETAKRYYDILKSKYGDCPVTAGAEEFLSLCKDNGIKMCILTAGIKPLADKVLVKNNLTDYFEFIATADSIDYDKRDPEAFIVCAEKLGLKIKDVLVIEDSFHAVQAAKKAGAQVIGMINSGNYFEHNELREICDKTIGDFNDLLPKNLVTP